jgi:hypothetical protein
MPVAHRLHLKTAALLFAACTVFATETNAAETVDQPFRGITHITRTETAPRNLRIHVVKIDLTAPGLSFKLTPPGGSRETVRQTTLEFLKQERAQVAINAHFFVPFPTPDTEVSLVGLAASGGSVYSGCEKPAQSYALMANAPAINIDSSNRAAIVHCDPAFSSGTHILEKELLWTTLSGSAQIVTAGVKTIPAYAEGGLTPGGPGNYSSAKSWYDAINARTAIGLSRDNRTLILFTVDARNGSAGMQVGEVAEMLIKDYGVYNALNLDGGGSTTLAIRDAVVNTSSDNPNGRSVGSNLAIFAQPMQ